MNVVSIAELQTVSNQTISNRTEEIPIVKQMIQEAINELKRWESYRNQTSETWVKNTIRLGTRGSQLAIAQANHIKNKIIVVLNVNITIIRTKGDEFDDPIDQMGGRGFC